MKDSRRPSVCSAPPRVLRHAGSSILVAILASALAPTSALAQVQRQFSVVESKRLPAHAHAPVARQLIPPASAQASAPPAPRPPLSLETDLLPLGLVPTATGPTKPAS